MDRAVALPFPTDSLNIMNDDTLKKLIRNSIAYASKQDASQAAAYPLYATDNKERRLYRAERLLTSLAGMIDIHDSALANELFDFLSSDADIPGGRPSEATQPPPPLTSV